MSNRREKRKKSFSNRLFGGIAWIMVVCILAIVFFDTRMAPFVSIFQAGMSLYDSHNKVRAIYNESPAGTEAFADKMSELEKSQNISVEIFNGKQRGDPKRRLLYSTDTNNKGLSGDALLGAERKYNIIDYKGTVLDRYDGTAKGSVDFSHRNKGDFYFEFRSLQPSSSATSKDEKAVNGYLVIIISVRDPDSDSSEPLYTMELYKLRSTLDEGAQFAIDSVLVLSMLLFGIALIVSLVFAKRFSRPLTHISEITKKLVRLDFSEKCPPSKIKEISELSENINAMTEALDASLQDLRQKNEKLQEDIENERTIEHLRAGFITNVSHELKTPIAIIQGYAEGLRLFIDEDAEMAKQYCSVIIDETAGMHVMVMKLLEIIKYDSGDYRPDYESFPLYEMVQDWFVRNAQILEEKGVTCENRIDREAYAYGDSMLLSSVLNNYLSNALSHVANERRIIAYMEEHEERYRIFIYNSGEHIASKDFEKIWTSFYRADKAMSRAEGRFGLGLAIVQSIQRLHDCDYGVKNVEGGVTFWFDVKKGTATS